MDSPLGTLRGPPREPHEPSMETRWIVHEHLIEHPTSVMAWAWTVRAAFAGRSWGIRRRPDSLWGGHGHSVDDT